MEQCNGCIHREDRHCKYHIELLLRKDTTCLFMKEGKNCARTIDRENPRNIKCEHCRDFDKGEATTAKNLLGGRGICKREKYPFEIEYWKKRACFTWPG